MGSAHAGQMAKQHPVRMQGAFRVAGGAGGVNDQRRIFRVCVQRLEHRTLQADLGMKIQHFTALGRRVDHIAQLQIGQARPDVIDLRQATAIGNDRAHRAVGGSMLDSVGTKQLEQWNGYRAQLVDGHVHDAGFQPLRKHDADPVAGRHALLAQAVGQAVGLLLKVQKTKVLDRTIRVLLDDCDPLRVGCPAITARLSDIESIRNIPLWGIWIRGRKCCHGLCPLFFVD